MVRQPTELVFAPVRELEVRILKWGPAGAVLLAIPSYIAGGRMRHKLRVMALAADRIATGDPLTIMPAFLPPDQLATDSASIGAMVETLTRKK